MCQWHIAHVLLRRAAPGEAAGPGALAQVGRILAARL